MEQQNQSVWAMLASDIEKLEEKVRQLHYLQQAELANSYTHRIDKLNELYKEKTYSESNQIIKRDYDEIIDEICAINYELDTYLQDIGKTIENKKTSERYTKKIGEIANQSETKSSEELWAGTRKIVEELKIDCERNPRLEAQQFNKLIAKQILRILIKQAKRGEAIDLLQAEELCSKKDLINALKDKLIALSENAESSEKKEEFLDTARYLDEKNMQNLETWQIVSGVHEVNILGIEEKNSKKEIKAPKSKSIFSKLFTYEGLGVQFPERTVYTFGNIDKKTGKWINLKKVYGDITLFSSDDVECIGDSFLFNDRKLRNMELLSVKIGEGRKNIPSKPFLLLPNGRKYLQNTFAWKNGNVQISDNTQLVTGIFDRFVPSIFTLGEIDTVTGERKNIRKVLGYISDLIDLPEYKNQVLEIEINDCTRINTEHRLREYPNLEKVVLNPIINSIDDNAFAYCRKLKYVEMNDNICNIDDNAFAFSGIEEIQIPDSVTRLGETVFASCRNLKKVIIGKGISEIPFEIFDGCPLLEKVITPPGIPVKYLGYDVLYPSICTTDDYEK